MMQIAPQIDPTSSGIMILNRNAKPLFERARLRAILYRFRSLLTRKSRDLDCFSDHFPAAILQKLHPFTAQVQINQIRGSVNRKHEFDCDFYPLIDAVETRWVRIASMMLQGKALPPVELVQADDSYFVIDGHHRISVSRMLGHLYIDAEVQSVALYG